MLITKEELKQHLDINTNDDDEILDIYINAVGEFLKSYLGRVIEKETITEYLDGDDINNEVHLENYPIVSLISFQYGTGSYSGGTYSTWNDFNEASYHYDLDKGIIYTDLNYAGIRNIKVVYVAGYADDDEDADDIPQGIKLATMKLVSKVYNKRRSEGYKTESVAGAAIEWDKFLSDDIKLILAPYRKIII